MRISGIVLLSLVLSCLTVASASAGSTCYGCHTKGEFVGKVTHKPVAAGECQKCHNPHVAKYEQLLAVSKTELCYECHNDLRQNLAARKNVHKPFAESDCLACHAPHSSNSKGLLRQDKVGETCFKCHEDLPREFKTEHRPFARGNCQACHHPHFADQYQLLNDTADRLCVKCHSGVIDGAHKKLPVKVKKSACVTCHSPHGSDRPALQRNVLHDPYQEDCGECHQNGRIAGSAKCLECHEEMTEKLNAVHSHQTSRSGNGCVNCHSPHASDFKNMLKNNQAQVCRTCHPDTWDNAVDKPHKHPDAGECSSCHGVHGSDNLAMLKGDGNATCETCHETQGVFTHPVGAGVIDPRNGQVMNCVTCHYPHGTLYEYNLKLSGSMELCIQCHKNY